MKKNIKENIIFIILYTFLLVVFLNRIIRGLDLTDESFYATIAYRLCNGNILFKDMWEQCSTSAILPAFILYIYIKISGGIEGIILLFRFTFFICNLLLLYLSYNALKIYVEKKYALLTASLFLIYAPFHLYTFSYNNQTDLFLLMMSCLLLLAQYKQKKFLYVLSGFVCAYMVFCYPTLFFIVPFICILIFIAENKFKKGCIYFILGGLICVTLIICSIAIIIGKDGIITGINGILSDPAYGDISIWDKAIKAFNHLFVVFNEDNRPILKIYILLILGTAYLKNRYPVAKFIYIIYPIIVFFQMHPISSLGTYANGTYAFYLSISAPFILFFLQDDRLQYKKLLLYMWLPSLLLYFVIAISSYGGAGQATQVLMQGAMVTTIGIIYIVKETTIECKIEKSTKALSYIVLSLMIIFEITIHYSVVYRDSEVHELTSQVTYGPYKGIYTTSEKKEYVEVMTDIMNNLSDENETVMVLYHSNFAYLMLNSTPSTPTTWGIYPMIDSENVFLKYFTESENNIPDTIYIVDVSTDFAFDYQRQEYYDFCDGLHKIIKQFYEKTDEKVILKDGYVAKYSLIGNKNKLTLIATKEIVSAIFETGFYGLEKNEVTSFHWCQKQGVLNIQNTTKNSYIATLKFRAVIPSPEKKKLYIFTENDSYEYDIDTEGLQINIQINVIPGNNIITLITDANQLEVEGDNRELYFTINDFEIDIK